MIESLEELLTIDTDSNKAMENKKLLSKVKQLLKGQNKKEVGLSKKAEDLPYEGISVIGNRLVTLKFDIDSKEAVVSNVEIDSRDTGVKQHMATYNARIQLEKIFKNYRTERSDKDE